MRSWFVMGLMLFPVIFLSANNAGVRQWLVNDISKSKYRYPIQVDGNSINDDNVANLAAEAENEIQFQPWEIVTCLDISPDGVLLAISAGNSVYLFDINTREKLSFIKIGALSHAISFNKSGEKIIIGSRDGFIREWLVSDLLNKKNPNPILTIKAHDKGVNSVKYAQNDAMIVSGGNDAVTRVWDESNGELLNVLVGGTFSVPDVDFEPTTEKLAIINGDTLRIREPLSGNILGTFVAEGPLFHLAFQPDGDILAVSDLNNHVLLWNVEDAFRSGKEKYPEPLILAGHMGENYATLVWDVVFNSKGNLLVSAGGDKSVRLWDPENASLITTLWGHTNAVTSVVFNPEEMLLVSGGLDARVIFWRIK